MRTWMIVIAVALASYALRASLVVLLTGRSLPQLFERATRYLGPAMMTAIAVSMLVR